MRRGEKRWKDSSVYIRVLGAFFVFLLLCLSAFFGAVKKSIEQNVRQTITANIDRQSVSFSSDITIQYQYLEGLAGYLGESGELCSENVMTLMRKVCEKSDLERIAIIAPDGTAHYSSGEVKNVAERDYFKRAMKGERCLSDPLESVVDGETRVILCVPVYHAGEVAGVLGGSYDVGALSHMLFEDIYGGAGYSLIVTADGEIVAYDGSEKYRRIQLDDNIFSYYAQMTFLEGDTFEMMRDGFANRISGSVKLGRDGDFRYLSYAPIDANDWMMCYIVPEKIVEAPYRTITRYETILLGMVLLGMAALVAYVFCMMLKRQKELEQAAQVDALTGILNKQSTETAIDGWLQEAHQKKQVFLMLDVDKFKEINDRYGHAAGDAALRQVGQTLVRLFRENDIVGRIGGDEFVILMKEVSSIRDAELKAEALCVLFRSLHPEGCPDEVHLSCSIGLVEVPEHVGSSYMELYQKADQALYEAKRRGRNCWVRHGMKDTEEKKEREAF